MRSRLVTAAAAAALPAVLALGAAPAIADAGGNNGTIKVAEVDQVGTDSNDPHVGCTFALEWYNFDSSATSAVTFESQDQDVTITGVQGTTSVVLEDDAAKGNSDLDGREIYTLTFAGEPHPEQGYHVKVTTESEGSTGNDSKSKVFWVGPCADGPTTPSGPTETGPGSTKPFTWDWKYAAPTCAGLSVAYPADIPSGQANDVNVRVETDHGQVTLNFHNNTGTWSGTTSFPFTTHPSWPAGVTSYHVTWVQVGGSNYHWQGDVACATDGDPLTPDMPQALTEVTGFRTGTITVARGATIPADSVEVEQAGTDELTLERYTGGTWVVAKALRSTSRGTARVTFPRLTKRGSYTYRLTVSRTLGTTGDTTGTLTVRVR
ncbi:hypothetical protein [Nocardioides sp. T2.26MG-1]|uniref:hypothetical protein n=1 Tax=Nocardioides sp. T2.26MG-1 TaxID=3041166 RepID=UPI002477BF04|nr:hypothetical protein [Nocardioides sp. T2.26MG-1]CAI9408752.1 hypothetical protein HIDPHFAB_01146 [Nocardioides sp. T2.26MG-1]